MNIGDIVEFYPTARDTSLVPLIGKILGEDTHNDTPYKWNIVQFRTKSETEHLGPDYQLKVLSPKEWFTWKLKNEDVE